jgi:hypothetical protein
MHQNRARKTNGFPSQAFDTCPECKVFAFDLLRLLFPYRVRAWIKMATIGPPAICIKVPDAKRRYIGKYF